VNQASESGRQIRIDSAPRQLRKSGTWLHNGFMRRFAIHLLLLVGLLLQGVVAVGAGLPHEEQQQQHCAGHYSDESCDCCPDGAASSMSCTAQCSVAQAPMVMLTVERLASGGMRNSFVQTSIPSPAYVPLVPPPIL
jgi:hypothetical protein